MAVEDIDFFEEIISDDEFGIPAGFRHNGADIDFVDKGETVETEYTDAGSREVRFRRIEVRVSDFTAGNPKSKTTGVINGVTYRIRPRRTVSTGVSYVLTLEQEFSD